MDERILTRTKLNENGCLEWCGCLNSAGYGQIRICNKVVYTHRYVWAYYRGAISKGMCICHRCDNPKCCNIDHLFLGTYKDNAKDMVAKNRNNPPRGEASPFAKLTSSDVLRAKALYKSREYSERELAKVFNVCRSVLKAAIIGKTWKHLL